MSLTFRIRVLVIFFLLCIAGISYGQKNNITETGSIIGISRDSLHNYPLKAATISVYNAKSNELLSFQLTNDLGKFQIKNLPVDTLLHVIATNFGYKEAKLKIIIPSGKKAFNVGVLNLEREKWLLQEVSIRSVIPPVQMRGDTLEFNAAAFKLDTTAVVGDLLQKLPGVTVWNDGVITVNGKKISRLLVDGKEFFGSDSRILLNNIPKNSIQKVQVYKIKTDNDPLNAKSEMNVVLKAGNKNALFGKLGVGYATQKHFAGDGMISYFSPRQQISVVSAANDVNKTANNVNTLMNFNSFKGEGINNDYHSDFSREGFNIFKGLGFTFLQDFNKETDTRKTYYKMNNLNTDLFYSNNENTTNQEIINTIALNDDHSITQTGTNKWQNNNSGLRTNANYEKRFRNGFLYTNYSFANQKSNNSSKQFNSSFNDLTQENSKTSSEQNGNNDQQSFSANIRGSVERFFDTKRHRKRLVNLDFYYNFVVNNSKQRKGIVTNFTSTDVSQDRYYNRIYLIDLKSSTHTINTVLRQFNGLFFSTVPGISIDINNILTLNNQNGNDNVSDMLPGTSNLYETNLDLTNKSNLKILDEKPGINIAHTYNKSLDNRYGTSLTYNILLQGQFYVQKNVATQSIQNIYRSNTFFVPTARVNYTNDQYGEFKNELTFEYLTSVIYPEIWQMAPLIDRASIYGFTIPNISLQPSYQHMATLSYNFLTQTGKNDLNANLNIAGGLTERNITDSVYYDALGRTIRRYINGDNRQSLILNGGINKAFKFNNHQLQFSGNTKVEFYEYNTLTNGQDYLTHTKIFNASAVFNYTYQTKWSGVIGQYYTGGKSQQGNLNPLTYTTWTTNLGLAYALPRSVFFNTRVNFNKTKATAGTPHIYYAIWNADIGYRFLKGSNAEVKFSALDLLHQNNSVINRLNYNNITLTKTNVLQQYFMLTVAYYPRKFNKNDK
ncbi:carboxypeptidase-like regulatory domain-containing protein [Mucilaginibacter gynuensis]|uniref:Carboxypeptidase-like regulatory domain-containing protein n=1 Tax=Mucilaginibacter gynuensis TaxID=1302236 RepID=A0ABP8H7H5_9SPHI